MIPADLRLRLVAALVLVVAISPIVHLSTALAALALAVLLALLSRPDPSLWHRLKHVEGFVALLVVTLPFTMPGSELLRVGPLAASVEGLQRSLLIGAKVTASALVVLSFLATEEPVRLGAALHGLGVPDMLVRLIVLDLRYLSLIRGEGQRLHDAMRARGFRPRSSRHTWRSYGNLIGMLLVRALDRAGRIDEAMRCRGFAGRFPDPALPRPPARDWLALGLLVALAVAGTAADRA